MEYIAINIPLGSLASIADGLLMVYLLKHSPVDVAHAGRFVLIALKIAIAIYFIIATVSKGTEIWNLLDQNVLDTGSNSSDPTTLSITIFQDLGTVATGMLLLFAISFAVLAGRYLHHLAKNQMLRKRVSFAVAALAAAFLVRNLVNFVFALYYSQYNHVAALGVQLIYMAFYGILSVIIFGCIVLIAASQEKQGPVINPRYGQVEQTAASEQDTGFSPYQTKSGATVDAFPTTQGYETYRY